MSENINNTGRLKHQTFMGLPTSHPAHLVIGLTVWCLWFVAVYGGLSVACELAMPDPARGAVNPINLALILITVASSLWLARGAWVCWKSSTPSSHCNPDSKGFIERLAASLYALSSGAALVVIGPMITLPPCF